MEEITVELDAPTVVPEPLWPGTPEGGFHRVLLKLSGEAFAGGEALGVDPDIVQAIARQIGEVVRTGVQVAV